MGVQRGDSESSACYDQALVSSIKEAAAASIIASFREHDLPHAITRRRARECERLFKPHLRRSGHFPRSLWTGSLRPVTLQKAFLD